MRDTKGRPVPIGKDEAHACPDCGAVHGITHKPDNPKSEGQGGKADRAQAGTVIDRAARQRH